MNTKKIAVTALAVLLFAVLPLAAQQQFFIPPQVTAVMDAGLTLKQGRSDIPMTYLKTLYLPAQQNQVYPVFLFQLKNADLGFAAAPEDPALLKSGHLVFIRVYRVTSGAPAEIVKERNIHLDLQEAQSEFKPEAMNYYSIAGDIYPAGSYLLVLALSTPDYAKIAVAYVEFQLPDFSQLNGKLASTPVFSVRELQMLPAAETKMIIHKNSFIYNTLLLSPNLTNEFKPSESLDLFYFILGGKPDAATNALNLQITYTFKKDGQQIDKLTPLTVASPIISQPIALTFTEVTRDAKGKETARQEKLLDPGEYILEIEMLDNVSKAKGLQEFKFAIVQ
jgi:hypothetical protein